MGRIKKSTRKFEKNHLKDTLERRKDFAKIKQRNQVKAKKKAKNAKEREDGGDDLTDDKTAGVGSGDHGTDNDLFGDMSVEQFFQGGFEIPEDSKAKGAKSKKAKAAVTENGKRKREEPEEEDEDMSSVPSSDGVASPSESEFESGAGDDIDAHKEELEKLKEKDPEFYKYLKENDAELLDFEGDEMSGLAELDGLSASEDKGAPKKKRKKQKQGIEEDDDDGDEEEMEVMAAMVNKWKVALAENNSLRAMRQVVLAFRAAAHVNEDDGKEYKYRISDPDVYHNLLILTLQHVPEVLNHHLPAKESASGKIRVPTESKKFRTLTPLLKSHSSAVLHLLSTLSDSSTIKLTISSLLPLIPYVLSFKKIVRALIKTVVDIWSDISCSEATRVTAFLVIRKVVVIGDSGLKEATLKTVYQGLVKGSRCTTVQTIQGINLMKNSAAELWGLDQNIGYTTGFSFIRQLAIHLRASITNNSKESYKTVYNWQYIHSLDFWSRVLSTHCSPIVEATTATQSPLRPLIYPVVQITLGALRLIPTAQYFPLRFQLTRSLLRLSRATGTYIPLAAPLLEVLTSTEMKKKPKKSATLKPLDFGVVIRAPKAYLRTRVYQDGVGEQVGELLAEFLVLWAKSVAFPELALPVIVMLKRWLKNVSGSSAKSTSKKDKGNRNGKLNTALGLLVQKLEANARWIEERRAKVNFSPADRVGVEEFLKEEEWERTPLGAFVVGQRKAREEKERLIEEGRREEEKKRKEAKEQDENELEESEEEEVEGSEDDDDDDDE